MYMCTSYAPIYDLPVCASTAKAACVSAFLFNQVSSSTLQFRRAWPTVTAITPSHVDVLKLALSARGAQLELTAQFLLCFTPAGFLAAVSRSDIAVALPALSGRASELAPTWVCLQELQSQRKLLHSYALKY